MYAKNAILCVINLLRRNKLNPKCLVKKRRKDIYFKRNNKNICLLYRMATPETDVNNTIPLDDSEIERLSDIITQIRDLLPIIRCHIDNPENKTQCLNNLQKNRFRLIL